jgi:CheY-like chemotaxis protein
MVKQMLVIDDEKNVQDLLLAIFDDRDKYEVTCAGDGQEALNMARSKFFDIIILDINLPKLSGYTLCRLIKGDPANSHVKIVMLSGMAQKYDCLKAKEVGSDGYFTKPFIADELVEAVRALTLAN